MTTLYDSDGHKVKCGFGHCEHRGKEPVFKNKKFIGDENHDEGLCWKITQEEFEDQPTDAKYCPCKRESGLIRRYARVGYMERGQHDQMITRECEGCGNDMLFTINDKLCISCKSGNILNEPIPGYERVDGLWVETI